MVQWYRRANSLWLKLLWWLVIGALLLTIPLAVDRYRTENTSKKVDIVFDYRDLLEISETKANPRQYVEEQLTRMRESRIRSMAVYESTLTELKLSRRIELYNSKDATALNQAPTVANENFTYVLFTDRDSQPVVQAMIEETFRELKVGIRPWTYMNIPGLILELPLEDANMKPMSPDPLAIEALRERGFHIVARLGNKRPFSEEKMDKLLQMLASYDVQTLLMDGETVPGYTPEPKDTHENIVHMAQLMQKYGMAVAIIEPVNLKVPQKGMTTLAKELDYNVVRLHSISEAEAGKLAENITADELEGRIRGVSDRLTLAVKDRNIRMIFLNARAGKNLDRGIYTDPLEAIYEALDGEKYGALDRMKDAGFVLDRAHSFDSEHSGLARLARPLAYIGAIGLIALTLTYFVPALSLAISVLGLLGGGALYVLSPVMTEKLLALGSTICAASLGIMLVIRYLQRERKQPVASGAWWKSILILLGATAVSGLGMLAVVGLHPTMPYMLQIEQFKGVKLLAYMPIVIAGVYLILFSEGLRFEDQLVKVRRILEYRISILFVIIAGVIGAAGLYYLSRTGNEGSAPAIEMAFRNFLETTLGVRPRNKEFLFAHPLLLLGVYLALKRHMAGLYLVLAGAIGQASAIGTFTHLHSPLWISFVRVLLGLGFGLVLGLVLLAAWEIISRGWRRWVRPYINL